MLQGTWGRGDGRDDEVELLAAPALCIECDHNLFYIVRIQELTGDVPMAMCEQCGLLHGICSQDTLQ